MAYDENDRMEAFTRPAALSTLSPSSTETHSAPTRFATRSALCGVPAGRFVASYARERATGCANWVPSGPNSYAEPATTPEPVTGMGAMVTVIGAVTAPGGKASVTFASALAAVPPAAGVMEFRGGAPAEESAPPHPATTASAATAAPARKGRVPNRVKCVRHACVRGDIPQGMLWLESLLGMIIRWGSGLV